jgi:hypothetical protein
MTISRYVAIFIAGLMIVLAGCGTESTGPGPGNGEDGHAVEYFNPYIGFENFYRIFGHNGDSLGISRFAIIDQFVAADFSGYVAVDSIPRWMDTLNWMDTFWIAPGADTVFQLARGAAYQERRPIVRNHTQTDLVWHLYSVGSPGTSGRYSVYFHQRPETETVVLTTGDIFTDCGRTDLLAVYEQSGDTALLGSEYFAPNIGKVLSSTRPFVESEIYYRELIR